MLTRDQYEEITIGIHSGPSDCSCDTRYLAGDGRVVVTDDLHGRTGAAENPVLASCRKRNLPFRSFLMSNRFLGKCLLDEFVLCSCDFARFGIAGNVEHLDRAFSVELIKTGLVFRDLRLPGTNDIARTFLLVETKSRFSGWSRPWRRS